MRGEPLALPDERRARRKRAGVAGYGSNRRTRASRAIANAFSTS